MKPNFQLEISAIAAFGAIPIDVSLSLLSLRVINVLNQLPRGYITLNELQKGQERFPLSKSPDFQPGTHLQIKLKNYGKGSPVVLFEGMVLNNSLKESNRGSEFQVELIHAAYRMTQQSNYRVFPPKTTDQKAVLDIVKAWTTAPGLPKIEKGAIKLPTTPYPNLVQFNATDWDFISWRASVTGRCIAFPKGQLSIIKPAFKAVPKLFAYDQQVLLDYEIKTDGQDFLSGVTGNSEMVQPGAMAKPIVGINPGLESVKLSPNKVGKAMGTSKYQLWQPVPGEEKELKIFANAELARSGMSLVQGRIKIFGKLDYELGDTLLLKKFGNLPDNKVIVSGISHQFDSLGWTTEIQFGLSKEWYAEQRDLHPKPAMNMLPPATGLQLAEVLDIKEAPDKDVRIKVRLLNQTKPAIGKLKAPKDVFWARLSMFYAGPKTGAWFRPEAKSLVVLGFLNDDPRHPVILGSMYRSEKEMPVPNAPENQKKGLVFKNDLGLTVDDKLGIITLATNLKGGAQSILLDKQKKQVIIDNGKKGTITIKDNLIDIKTTGNLKMHADGNLEISAGGKVTIKGASVELK